MLQRSILVKFQSIPVFDPQDTVEAGEVVTLCTKDGLEASKYYYDVMDNMCFPFCFSFIFQLFVFHLGVIYC